jgi:hypothetical protein
MAGGSSKMPHSRLHPRPPRGVHHFVGYLAKEEGIGPVEVLDSMTMQIFVRDRFAVIAAPV